MEAADVKVDYPKGEGDREEMELKVFETPGKEWDEFASRHTDLDLLPIGLERGAQEGVGRATPLFLSQRRRKRLLQDFPGFSSILEFSEIFYASIPYGNLIGEKIFFPPLMELLEKEFQRRGIDQVRITESPFSESYHPEAFKSILAKCSLLDLKQFDERKGLGGVQGVTSGGPFERPRKMDCL